MNLKHLLLLIITLFAMGSVMSASAASMRCGVHIIQTGSISGTGKYEVEKKCGAPTQRYGNTWIYVLKGREYTIIFKDNGTISTISG
jgi:hypothetical protein